MLLRRSWRAMDRVRREISRNLVEAALAAGTVRRFVQESFAPIYESAGDAWVTESAPVRPADYNRSVLEAESQAERFSREGRVGVVLRFGLFYGPEDPPTSQLVDAVRRGWFPLPGRPEAYISWIAHDDAASAVVAALGVPAGTYDVVDDEPLRRRVLGEGIAELLGVRPPRFLPGWLAPLAGAVGETMARSLRISNRKMKEAGGWQPRYGTILDGLADVISPPPKRR